MQEDNDWWRGAVIYQIYPRSFYDANGDGVGDLQGVTAKLGYVADLGVDAIWLSPFFTSPMKDAGYDVSNFRDVDPVFGTLRDFDRLLEKAHGLGLKVIIDHVLSHSSDQHPWFEESRSDRHNPKADWYVWADPLADGCPPNNWLAVFGGTAWTWDTRRRQYYFHNFLPSQPDLNFHNPHVVEQVLANLEFWLQKGVDGFRLDASNHCFHDKLLRSNPPNPRAVDGTTWVRADNPYAYQSHLFDKTQPENLDFLLQLRQLMDQYPGTTTMGEIGDDNAVEVMAAYTSGNSRLHMAYSFDFLSSQCSIEFIRGKAEKVNRLMSDGWPCWAIGNHDVPRVMSRWVKAGIETLKEKGRETNKEPVAESIVAQHRAEMFMVLLLTLRGSVCLYQGDELGFEESDLAFEQLVDPYGINFWPQFKGRDGCRTPIPWQADAAFGGFSRTQPWLPIDERHLDNAVDRQLPDNRALLHSYREFIGWRKRHSCLQKGEIRFHQGPVGVLVYQRWDPQQDLLIVLNFTSEEISFDLPFAVAEISNLPRVVTGQWQGSKVSVRGHGIAIASVSN